MTPRMLRPIAWIAGAIAVIVAVLWAMQGDSEAVIDYPLPAILGFAAISALAAFLSVRSGGTRD